MKIRDSTHIWIIFLVLACWSCRSNDLDEDVFIGAVSSASPEATEAGALILRKGGNAVDAAIALSFVLGVTEPAMSGIGGGCQVLLSLPGKDPLAINGTTRAPSSTDSTLTKDDLGYRNRSTIPSMVKTMDYLFKNYGSGNLTWSQLLEPAIDHALRGFRIGAYRAKVYQSYASQLKQAGPSLTQWLLPDGTIPSGGDTIRQPVLAQTLRTLSEQGAEDFYSGSIARKIDHDMRKNGGWITFDDLASFPEPEVLSAVKSTYKGFDIYTSPPPSGGWTMLLALKMLEKYQAVAGQGEPSRIMLVKALNRAHYEREAHTLDPNNYQEDFNNRLDRPDTLGSMKSDVQIKAETEIGGGETTHFSLVDAEGIAVSITASINAYFGCKAAAEELGFLYNSYMDDFYFNQPGHLYGFRANNSAYSSMSPTIVRSKGRDMLILGSPGSKRIISTVAQVIYYWVDGKQDIRKSLETPRVHALNNEVWLEAEDPEFESQLNRNGFNVNYPSPKYLQNGLNAYFGGVHAIAREHGSWQSAADPRRDGVSLVVK